MRSQYGKQDGVLYKKNFLVMTRIRLKSTSSLLNAEETTDLYLVRQRHGANQDDHWLLYVVSNEIYANGKTASKR